MCVCVLIYSIIPLCPTFEGYIACRDKPCRNGGTCRDKPGGGVLCNCAFGFEGVRCKGTYVMYRNTLNHERA